MKEVDAKARYRAARTHLVRAHRELFEAMNLLIPIPGPTSGRPVAEYYAVAHKALELLPLLKRLEDKAK